jgi:hypothetical protein
MQARRTQTHRYFIFVCDRKSFAMRRSLGAKKRAPPVSSPPFAGAHVGRCAVVIATHAQSSGTATVSRVSQITDGASK